jgi:hypothetical protein
MNDKRYYFLAVFLLCLTPLISALGSKEKEKPQPARTVQVTGLVRLVGTAILPELVISNPEGEWYIAKEERDKLFDLQQRTVTVEGEETLTELRFANGMSAGIRRDLRKIRVILVE